MEGVFQLPARLHECHSCLAFPLFKLLNERVFQETIHTYTSLYSCVGGTVRTYIHMWKAVYLTVFYVYWWGFPSSLLITISGVITVQACPNLPVEGCKVHGFDMYVRTYIHTYAYYSFLSRCQRPKKRHHLRMTPLVTVTVMMMMFRYILGRLKQLPTCSMLLQCISVVWLAVLCTVHCHVFLNQ